MRDRADKADALAPSSGPLRVAATAAVEPARDPGGRGRALDGGVAARLGHALGHNFSDVRIFDDPAAAPHVDRQGAMAAAVGRDIAFAPGAYQPGTLVGDALLAHELAHVQQQSGGGRSSGTADTAALETDATGAAVGAMADLHGMARPGAPRGATRSAPVGVQRCGGAPSWAPAVPRGSMTPPATATPGMLTGEQVDAMVTANPTVGPYVTGRVNPTGACAATPRRAAGHTHYLDSAQMSDAYVNSLSRSTHPAHPGRCGRTFNETEARAATAPGGFRDHDNETYVLISNPVDTPLHEGLHRLQNDAIRDELGDPAMEGATEYLTRKIMSDAGTPSVSRAYPDEFRAIRTQTEGPNGIGTPALCEAYFNANFGPMRAAMDRVRPGRYEEWKRFMKLPSPDYPGANTV